MAATKQTKGEALLKCWNTSCITKHLIQEWKFQLCFQEQWACKEHSFKMCTNWTCRMPSHCIRNVWLPTLHRIPPVLCSGGDNPPVPCVLWWGEGTGSAKGLTSVADSFLGRADMLLYHEWVLEKIWAKHLTLMRTFMSCAWCSGTSWLYPENYHAVLLLYYHLFKVTSVSSCRSAKNVLKTCCQLTLLPDLIDTLMGKILNILWFMLLRLVFSHFLLYVTEMILILDSSLDKTSYSKTLTQLLWWVFF